MLKRVGETRSFHALREDKRRQDQQHKPLARQFQSATYIDPPGLFEAIDAAMLLGLPLLLTGEPGSGKTQAAYWLSDFLGEKRVDDRSALLRTDVKSTMMGRDLLYRFDDVARFRDSAAGGTPRPLIEYLEFEALGEAILRAAGGQAEIKPLGSRDVADVALRAFGEARDSMRAADLLPGDPDFAGAAGAARVVLIDELDKAPRDTPNDLLAEIENMAFSIPELGLRVEAHSGHRPITIISSNSERDLPEPFLRRCLFFHIPFPDAEQIRRIVAGSVEAVASGNEPLVKSATDFFYTLHQDTQLAKRPGTAELLAWVACLSGPLLGLPLADRIEATRDQEQQARLLQSLGCLVKTKDDFDRATGLLSKMLAADHGRLA